MEIWPGTPYPLGATYDGTGTNFALFSEVAERVGYGSASNFSTAFTRHVGQPPSRYAREHYSDE